MIKHYLKIAFRNLWKYKNQTLVSVIGLAVGFACFAVATLWIRYEITFDRFHKNADRIYCVYLPATFVPTGISRLCPHPLAEYLKKTFPEIVRAVSIWPASKGRTTILNGVEYPIEMIGVDSSFFSMFDIKIVDGSMDFLIDGSKKLAITRKKALQMFGNESPIGKPFADGVSWTIGAVVTEFPRQTNHSFDFLEAIRKDWTDWNTYGNNIFIELHPNIDIAAFKKKLYEHKIKGYDYIMQMSILPLTSVHYKDPNVERDVKFHHIVIFSVAGLLLILCTLFNYLTLFISRFRIRQREFALRVVYGASNRSLFTLLSVEFIMSLSAALLLGLYLIYLILPEFIRLSGVRLEQMSIYFELLTYITVIIVISLLAFIATIIVFRRRSLDASIRNSNRRLFRRVSIAVQLIISIGFMFCTTVILKQMYHLHSADLGFASKNRGSVILYAVSTDKIDVLENKLQQIPDITETIKGINPMLPAKINMTIQINSWQDKPVDVENMSIGWANISEQYQKYYELKLVEGEFLSDNDAPYFVLINESAMKACGWHTAVGKLFGNNRMIIKGVVKNIYNAAPTLPASPMLYSRQTLYEHLGMEKNMYETSVLFKFSEGTWKSCKKRIEEIVKTEYPGVDAEITSTEEEYDKFLKSENTLLRILTLVSLVCVIVCVFGFVSMVSLTCEERRKEIAIRKIHGATIKDILDIFFKEYLTLLIVGALIAFPVGYIIMKGWLESYVVQTEISAWIYVSILLALIMAIVLCVGGKVYRTSRANPAEEIKKF
jgi:ABC-type antimicrobial peptide transport system permease subunit